MATSYLRKTSVSYFTSTDKMAVVTEAVRLMRKESALTRLEALRRGMSVLPEAKRRNIKDMAHARWSDPLFEELKAPASRSIPAPAASLDLSPPSKTLAAPPVSIKRVVWTREERVTVLLGMLRQQADFPDLSDFAAFKKSVEYNLPVERQRVIKTIATETSWIKPLLPEVRASFEADRAAVNAQRVARETEAKLAAQREAERVAHAEAEAQRIELEKWTACEEAVEAYKRDTPIEELFTLIAKKAGAAMLGTLVETLQSQVLSQLTASVARAPLALHMPGRSPVPMESSGVVKVAPRERKARVLVVGLLKQQQTELRASHGSVLDLSFVDGPDQSNPNLVDKARHMDLIIMHTKFLSHETTIKLRKVNENVRHETGTLSSTRRFLTAWVNGEVAIAA